MGNLSFTDTGKFNDCPNLSYFNYTQAKNGGPLAMMVKDRIVMVGQKTPTN